MPGFTFANEQISKDEAHHARHLVALYAGQQRYSEQLVETTGIMVISSFMFEDSSAVCFRLGFAKAGFDERLRAWEQSFGVVPLPGA